MLIVQACGGGSGPIPLTGVLPVAAPNAAHAGQSIQVTVGPVEVDNGTPIGMVLVGTFGPRVYNSVFEAGMAQFIIPPEHTLQPGYVALIFAAQEARGEASIVLFTASRSSTTRTIAQATTPTN